MKPGEARQSPLQLMLSVWRCACRSWTGTSRWRMRSWTLCAGMGGPTSSRCLRRPSLHVSSMSCCLAEQTGSESGDST